MMGATGTEVVVIASGIIAVIGAGYSIHRALRSIRAWVRRIIAIAKHEFSDAVDTSKTGHLVTYHLGPNGTTTPMHQRVTENQATELRHHQQNTALLAEVVARLAAVEAAQQTAASTAVAVDEEVETERARRDDPPTRS